MLFYIKEKVIFCNYYLFYIQFNFILSKKVLFNQKNKYFLTVNLGFIITLKPYYDSLCEIALGNEFAKEILNIYSSNNN